MDKKFIAQCKETSTQNHNFTKPQDWLSTWGVTACDQGIWVKGAHSKLPRRKPRAWGWAIN